MKRLRRNSCSWILAAALVSCGSSGQYTWVQDLPQGVTRPSAYAIDEGDLLDIRVYNEPAISGRARVRSDGKVTVALVGDVDARGKTPNELAREVQQRLQKFLQTPSVSIAIEEIRPLTITVMGEVGKPGVFTLNPNSGVLQAIASAGGFSEYADDDRIYVVRRSPGLRVRFSYEGLRDNAGGAADFVLKNGDLVTVE
ncbi:MAG TPA: polysaccharide biosynthesis/export family protein [Polyangiaceae bacterium]|nr:polysaccharide biosynthesis/export family protein [Polyangiaceae bacterium]